MHSALSFLANLFQLWQRTTKNGADYCTLHRIRRRVMYRKEILLTIILNEAVTKLCKQLENCVLRNSILKN